MSVESCATRVQRLPSGSSRKRLVRSASTSRVAEATMSSRSGCSCRTPVIACATARSVRRSWSFLSTVGAMVSGDMLLSLAGGFDAMIEKVRDVLARVRTAGRSALLEHEVYAVLAAAGFDVPRFAYWAGEPGVAAPGRGGEPPREDARRGRPQDRLPGDPPQVRRRGRRHVDRRADGRRRRGAPGLGRRGPADAGRGPLGGPRRREGEDRGRIAGLGDAPLPQAGPGVRPGPRPRPRRRPDRVVRRA